MHAFCKLLLKSLDIPERQVLVLDLKELRNRHAANAFRLYDKVIPVLSDLEKRHKVTSVSNCSGRSI